MRVFNRHARKIDLGECPRTGVITVRLLGGARKAFGAETVEVEGDKMTVRELLDSLKSRNPRDLDLDSLLVAINGADSAVSGGESAVVKTGDEIALIPVVHGGSTGARFKAGAAEAGAFPITPGSGGAELLDRLRAAFPRLALQAVSQRLVLGSSHVQKILLVSLQAKKRGIMLSKRIETDILMRFAGTNQISRAIEKAGAAGKAGFVLIAVGPPSQLDGLRKELGPRLRSGPFPSGSRTVIMRELGITKAELAATGTRTPLEDVLAERAAVLFR
ncbi:hypothetical protein CENSYa_1383 [Cenarchaeum symbiosum A]|uniref:MoaD/ThiS family protein n=1 Tax=Cenarchaeum symbiosum (strain A) TaxID=414004 RepID=A0RXD9_CENSY|nr:hypothetical protein CENSYa_1383 [Cenarchaeum symbiosum A]